MNILNTFIQWVCEKNNQRTYQRDNDVWEVPLYDSDGTFKGCIDIWEQNSWQFDGDGVSGTIQYTHDGSSASRNGYLKICDIPEKIVSVSRKNTIALGKYCEKVLKNEKKEKKKKWNNI